MQYELLSILEGIDRCRSLFAQNFAETGLPHAEFRLHMPTYQLLDDARCGFCIIAYKDEQIVGYSFVVLFTHQHTSRLCAQNDTVWVRPEFRNSGLGGRLIVRSEQEARKHGAESFLWSVPEGTPIDSALATRHCYQPIQKTYVKEL